MALTDTEVKAAKPSESKRKLSDGQGLQLLIMPSGGKSWLLAYRFGGRQKSLAIGPYPRVSLRDARKRRDEAKDLLDRGIDPAAQRKLERLTTRQSAENTFGGIADELLGKKRREGKASSTLAKLEWLFGLAKESLGARPIAEVTAPEVLAALQAVERRGRLETAKRLRAVIGEAFRFAIATGRASTDPTFALRGALTSPVVRHRAAILDPKGFGALLRAIEGYAGQPTTKAALQLAAYLFPRPGELRQAEWIEFDLEARIWTVPASRAKMRRPHKVPIPSQALTILQSLRPLTERTGLVFPGHGRSGGEGRRAGHRPISENALNGALRRMGYASEEMSSHGFRAVASTLLNESGKFSPDAIERALAHQDKDSVRRAYARGEFWDERVRLMDWWADRIDAMRDGAKIIPIEAGKK